MEVMYKIYGNFYCDGLGLEFKGCICAEYQVEYGMSKLAYVSL